ncbi:MAG: NAD(P)-dependent oxidoreductase [Bacteroidia bacterium]
MNILITESQDYSQKAMAAYALIGKVETENLNKGELIKIIPDYEVIVIRLAHVLDKEVLNAAQKLRYIITPTTGLDHIDTSYCAAKGIQIISLKGEQEFLNGIPSTAEHSFALLLALVRNIPSAFHHVKEGKWDRQLFRGHNLQGRKIGILGMGRVGSQVAGFARAFGMEVLTFDPSSAYVQPWMKQMDSAEELFSQSSILSIHIPLNQANIGFVSSARMELLPQASYLINTSRGDVWDENAVATALKSGKLGGVATDVITNETDPAKRKNNPLLQLAVEGYNVLITPHIAGATYESMHLTEEFVADKFTALVNTKKTEQT